MNQGVPPKIVNAGKHSRSRLILTICAAFLLLGFVVIGVPQLMIHIRSERDFSDAKEKLNPEELRDWAVKMTERYPPTSSIIEIPREEVPLNVRNAFQKPPWAFTSQRGIPVVQLEFGGGFSHWFIAIGPTNFEWATGGYFQSKKWVPGIYFVREH
jgi:hypothetical protein